MWSRSAGVGEKTRKLGVRLGFANQGRAYDHALRSYCEQPLRIREITHPATDLAGKALQNPRDERTIVALAFGGVQVDQLHQGEAGKAVAPFVELGGLVGLGLALYELNNFSAH